jgi:hypothetical protein
MFFVIIPALRVLVGSIGAEFVLQNEIPLLCAKHQLFYDSCSTKEVLCVGFE